MKTFLNNIYFSTCYPAEKLYHMHQSVQHMCKHKQVLWYRFLKVDCMRMGDKTMPAKLKPGSILHVFIHDSCA